MTDAERIEALETEVAALKGELLSLRSELPDMIRKAARESAIGAIGENARLRASVARRYA